MEFVAELEQFEVLQSNQIIKFKNFIQKKYPTASLQHRSEILADAIDKVIDKHIQDFDKVIRDQVKFEVLQRAVMTDNYNISGSDIFRACLFIKDTGENFNASLTHWLNKTCCNPIEEKYIDLLLSTISNCYHEYYNCELDYIIGKSIANLEDEHSIDLTLGLDTSYSGGLFVERVLRAYKYLKREIIREYIPYQILVTSLLLIALSNQFVVGQDNRINGINPQLIFVGLQYQGLNDEALLAEENRYQENDLNEQPIYDLHFQQVDENSLIQFLVKKGSLLCAEPYFSSIIQASHEYDINPLLLFAITGQEQAFVPKDAKNAERIANNPFNVYGSWQVYNTNILDSARIAANLVATLNKNRPSSIDPIFWINTKYAQDKMWHIGVTKLFKELNKAVKTTESDSLRVSNTKSII